MHMAAGTNIVQFFSLIKHTRIYVFFPFFPSNLFQARRVAFNIVVRATEKRFNGNLLKIAHERAIFERDIERSDNVDGGLVLVVCLMVVFAEVFIFFFCWALL